MSSTIPINRYLKANLFEELGIKTLTPEEQISFLDGFGSVIQYRITFRVMEELSGEQKDQLDKLLSNDNPDAVFSFLVQELPTFQNIVEEEVAKYKKELIDRMKAK